MRHHAAVVLLLLLAPEPLCAQTYSAEPGEAAPDFTLPRLDGGRIALADLRGRPVLINFWATWCRPCRTEMPELVSAYATHRAAGLEIVAVNLTDQENGKDVRRFVAELGMLFPIALDEKGKVRERYRLVSLPTSIFVDTAGVVRVVHPGPISAGVLAQGLDSILPGHVSR